VVLVVSAFDSSSMRNQTERKRPRLCRKGSVLLGSFYKRTQEGKTQMRSERCNGTIFSKRLRAQVLQSLCLFSIIISTVSTAPSGGLLIGGDSSFRVSHRGGRRCRKRIGGADVKGCAPNSRFSTTPNCESHLSYE